MGMNWEEQCGFDIKGNFDRPATKPTTIEHPVSLISRKKVEDKIRRRLQVVATEANLYAGLEVQGYKKALEWVLRDILEVSAL